MLIRIHRETRPGERRVALVPRTVQRFVEAGHRVVMPAGVGMAAGYSDDQYTEAGAEIVDQEPADTDLVAAVGPVTADDVAPTRAVVSFLDPLGNPVEMTHFANAGIDALSMELIPRTTLAQSMDALSSQATSAGYEAVILAAAELPKFFPMLMTAAGTIPPAKVLVLGAGVAGLQAIASARRMGALVAGYDIRPEAGEQVESLGATFVGGPVEEQAAGSGGYAGEVTEDTRARQLAALAEHVAAADVVITTAQVPGRKAPLLITREMVEDMRPGSVLVDLAASTGGNCEVTEAGKTVDLNGVKVIGPVDLSSLTATHSSEMYSRNVFSLIEYLSDEEGNLVLDPEDEIVACAVVRDGEITDERVRSALEGGS